MHFCYNVCNHENHSGIWANFTCQAMDKGDGVDTGSVSTILKTMQEVVGELSVHVDTMDAMQMKPKTQLIESSVKATCCTAAPLFTKCKSLHEDILLLQRPLNIDGFLG